MDRIAEAKGALKKLIDRYNNNKEDKSFIGNEKQACQSLIVPLIKEVLHWETDDPSEFKAEYSQGGKRIDYVVCNQGISQFIVEAKAPSKDIFDNDDFYQQAIDYGYGKEHDFAILTNFRQIVILAPNKSVRVVGEAAIHKIDLLSLTDEDLSWLLCFEHDFWLNTKDSPLYGLLKKYSDKVPVSDKLLDDLKHWRELLLKNIKQNSGQNHYDFEDEEEFMHIEEEVQRLIDRLIFICFCEDKELHEPELKVLIQDKKNRFALKHGYLLEKIRELFVRYKATYNSDLFDKGDCDNFHLDDDKIFEVLEGLREPKGRVAYDFKSIEADILGKVYENFIGHLTTGKKRFDEKEDKGKRKSSGIYYTPKYIVDYIVNNTVREYVKGKSFEEINKVKILDPACGSGSFLLRAFDVLVEESKKSLKRDLSYEEKKNLMLNCIHGVDLDKRAVEVAKLSLSLRLVERDKKLPLLADNIQSGNSLIDDKKIAGWQAFVWEEQFKGIMNKGGFDIIVGNPPYFKIFEDNLINTIQDYKEIKNGMMNISAVFINRFLKFLKPNGYLGMIVPKMLAFTDSWEKIRQKVLKNYKLIKAVDCGKAFKDVLLEQIIFILQNEKPKEKNEIKIGEIDSEQILETAQISQRICIEENSIYLEPKHNAYIIKEKMESNSVRLGEISKITLGIGIQSMDCFKEQSFSGCKKVLRGNDIQRYLIRGYKYYDPNDKNLTSYIKTISSFEKKHIVAQRIVAHIKDHIKITATFDEEGLFSFNTVTNIFVLDKNFDEKYILALLNSNPIQYYTYKFIYKNAIRSMDFYKAYAEKIPLPKADLKTQKKIIDLVEELLNFNKKQFSLKDKPTNELAKIKEMIHRNEEEINGIIYRLYNLSNEEQKIIEESLQ